MKSLLQPIAVGICLFMIGCGQQQAAPFDSVDDSKFEQLIASNPVVVVNFTADW